MIVIVIAVICWKCYCFIWAYVCVVADLPACTSDIGICQSELRGAAVKTDVSVSVYIVDEWCTVCLLWAIGHNMILKSLQARTVENAIFVNVEKQQLTYCAIYTVRHKNTPKFVLP